MPRISPGVAYECVANGVGAACGAGAAAGRHQTLRAAARGSRGARSRGGADTGGAGTRRAFRVSQMSAAATQQSSPPTSSRSASRWFDWPNSHRSVAMRTQAFHLTEPVGPVDNVLGPDHAPVTLV